jgi:hypothetical protein
MLSAFWFFPTFWEVGKRLCLNSYLLLSLPGKYLNATCHKCRAKNVVVSYKLTGLCRLESAVAGAILQTYASEYLVKELLLHSVIATSF